MKAKIANTHFPPVPRLQTTQEAATHAKTYGALPRAGLLQPARRAKCVLASKNRIAIPRLQEVDLAGLLLLNDALLQRQGISNLPGQKVQRQACGKQMARA